MEYIFPDTGLVLKKYNATKDISVVDYGKFEGKKFTELTREDVVFLLTKQGPAMYAAMNHLNVYCSLHRYALFSFGHDFYYYRIHRCLACDCCNAIPLPKKVNLV